MNKLIVRKRNILKIFSRKDNISGYFFKNKSIKNYFIGTVIFKMLLLSPSCKDAIPALCLI
jgi:hypothetical protein